VDWLVEFGEDTPLELIKALQPDVLVKGGDYNADDVVGGNEVRANGGDVVIIDFLPSYSTSGLVSKINKEN